MKTKYYVSMGRKIRILVTADNPVSAIAHAISYMSFEDTTDIPESLLEWPDWLIDERGFRDYTTMDEQTIIIPSDEGMDAVDEQFRFYDPFCEFDKPPRIDPKAADNYYFGLGEPE